MIIKRLSYKNFKLKVHDTQDSYWVSIENKAFQDCTERFNDADSAIDSAKNMVDKLKIS